MSLLFLWSLSSSLTLSPSSTLATDTECVLLSGFDPGFVADGDFVIGGIFPLHYNQEMPDVNYTYQPTAVRFDPRAFRWAQTMRLAVEEINQSEQLLPNHMLGYKIFDSCAYPLTGQRAALAMLNGLGQAHTHMCSGASPLLAVIGESGSAQSIVVSRILQPFKIPMISYFSSCACLGDRRKYPTFFRVIPNDDYQVKAMAQLLVRYDWRWVGVVRGDHEYGHFALQGLLRELKGTGVCVAYQEMIPLLYNQQRALEIIEVISLPVFSTARVVVVFSAEGEMTPFLKDYMAQNITGIQWVASEAWVTASLFTTSEYFPYLGGTIGFGIRQGQIPGLRDYLQTVNPRSTLIVAYNVYKAVYAIAHSLHNLLHCQAGAGPFHNRSCAHSTNVHPWQLQHYLQELAFYISGEEVNFDLKGDSIPYYDIINWQRGSGGNMEFINLVVSVCSASCAPGSRKAVRRGESLCCFDCVPCDSGKISNQTDSIDCTECPEDYWSNADGTMCIPKVVEFLSHDAMGIALTVIAVVGACLTVSILAVFLHHRTTPIVRVNNSELSFFILLSLTLCFLCALMFIGEPTSWSCMLRHTAFSITFSLCISCILSKTLVVLAAFTAARPGNNIMKWLGPKQQRVIIFSCTLVQVLICAAWLIAAPPYPSKNIQDQRSKIILECSVGSQLAFWCVLGYIGLLACLCFILAFLARKLPGNFNEAKFITFSMLIFCAVWISFIPAYVSSPGKYTVAVEIFAILASSFGLLFCLFAPKCYIILLKPEKNTKQHLMGNKKYSANNEVSYFTLSSLSSYVNVISLHINHISMA
uniref:G-protein coupled receptors family 3 profile domain-containing protein n=1 Tax=Oncorhynchus mykiss TaxID=8022 RepID=A0A8C7UAP8_ONCMY